MTENVYLFVPNIIGYTRIALAITSYYFMTSNYVAALWCYIISTMLDLFDGLAARTFNQSSRLGAMLDMLTDMTTTMCLQVVLSYYYPKYIFLFQISMTIEIVSHWLHTHSSLMLGANSHKEIDPEGDSLLRLYYTNQVFLVFVVAGNQLFYAMLYLCHFTYGTTVAGLGVWQWLCITSFLVALGKTWISLIQLKSAVVNIVAMDKRDGQTYMAQKSQ